MTSEDERQDLRIACLEISVRTTHISPLDVVRQAQEYYDFVTAKEPEKKQTEREPQ